jgi:hypothetical protein
MFKYIAVLLLLVGGAMAQIIPFPGVPSGTCPPTRLALDLANGHLYSCNNGSWLEVGPGAAGSADWSTLLGGTNSGQAFLIGNGGSLATTGTGVINANQYGGVGLATVSATEFGYLDGVTSAIQTQIGTLVPKTTTVAGKALSSNIAIATSDLSDISAGGSANGQVLIWDNVALKYTPATITAGANVTVTNGQHSITIAATGGGGGGGCVPAGTIGQMLFDSGSGTCNSDTATTDGSGNLTATSYSTSGSNGGFGGTEGTGANAPAKAAGFDRCFPASTGNGIKCSFNNDTDSLLARAANTLAFFSSTTSAQLAGVISDETGTGVLMFNSSPTIAGHVIIEGVTATGATGTGNFVFSAGPTLTGHPTIEGVTSTGATGTGKFVFDASPTITGHITIEGVTATGATGTGKFVFDASPTITGHATVEGVTATGATGIGKFVFDTSSALINPLLTMSSIAASTGTGQRLTGSSLTAGTVYYFSSGGLAAAKADAAGTMPGVCIADTTTSCVYSGVYRYSSSQSWTVGGAIYVSASAAGSLVQTAPASSGNQVQKVGTALANDTILIQPSLDVGGVQ